MNDFKIEFDNLPVFYTPGQMIHGNVLFNVTKDEEKIVGLSLRFIGRALVEWTESGLGLGLSKIITFSKEETYLNELIYLDRKDDGQITTNSNMSIITYSVLPRGLHTFPFNFKLPLGIPSSLEEVYGTIRYSCEAMVEIKHRKRKEGLHLETKQDFIVNDILDLNNYPEFFQSIQLRKSKNIWCLCCQSGPVGFNVILEKTGFLAGEPIPNIIELFNSSNRNVPDTHITLVRDMYFHTDLKTKTLSKTILGTLCLPSIEPGENLKLETSWEIIPRTAPSNLLGCSIITVKHYLMFEMNISSSFNLCANIPVIIGMIPFRDNSQGLELGNEMSSK